MLERRTAYVAWIAWLLGLVWMVAAYLTRSAQPNFWPLLILLAVQMLSAIVGLTAGAWHLCRGPRRLAATGWMLIGMGPICLWAAHISYTVWFVQGRQLDSNLMKRVSRPALLALADAAAHALYPECTEGRHVVMIHNGMLDSPEQDVRAMDRHLERMQESLGRKMRSKVRWVRGSLLGVGGRGGDGWALGSSDAESRGTDELSHLDLHEAAHAILDTMEHGDVRVPLDREAPAILVEGWAELQSGNSGQTLLQKAWDARRRGHVLPLCELTTEDWYHRHWSPAYTQGGPLVEYVLHEFGPQKFFELYMTARRATFAEDCKRILGLSLDELDRAYWDYVERRVDPEGVGGLSYVQLASDVDRSLWREVVKGHLEAAENVRQLSGPLHAQCETSVVEFPDSEPPREVMTKTLELLVDGDRLRLSSRLGRLTTIIIASPDCSFSLVRRSDEEAWQPCEGTQIGTQLWDFRRQRHRIVSDAFPMLAHYAYTDGAQALWNAKFHPLVNRVECISRGGRELVLVAFENRAEAGVACEYTSGELYFDPANHWALRCASLRRECANGGASEHHLSFEFELHENNLPLVRSHSATREEPGEITTVSRSTSKYNFDPQIAADDFSPAKYGLTSRPRGLGRSPSWYLVLSLALAGLSMGGGALALLVDRWLTHRKSVRNSSASSGTETAPC